VPRCAPSANRPMVFFLGRLKDLDIVTSLLEHAAKITPGDSSTCYRKVHLD
jgi:hypothetical protein